MDYNSNQYFATLETDKIGAEVFKRIDEYYRFLTDSGRAALLHTMYQAINRPALLRGAVASVGRQGEYKFLSTNHLRNLCDHRTNLTVTQRPHYEPKAANTDYKSQAQVILARGLLDYYNRTKRMERYNMDAVSKAVTYAESFVYTGWNVNGGDKFANDPENNRPIMEGDLEFETFTTFDVVRPVDVRKHDKALWLILRIRKNKYVLASENPNLANRILGIEPKDDYDYTRDFIPRTTAEYCKEDIDVWYFFHKPCAALPEGRLVELVQEDLILHSGALPYNDIPIHRISAGEMDNYFFGYTNAFDCLPLQETYDKLTSTIVTNQATYGVQNILVPQGSSLDVTKLGEGLNVIYYSEGAGKPEALQLVRTAPEMFTFTTELVHTMETIMGVNSVARGNPESNLESGAALALVQSMAVQFAQSLQYSYVQLLEDTGTGCIQLLQRYAATKRVALLAGHANRSYMKEFTGDDIDLIQRVIVDMGNPMMSTVGGRLNLGEMLMKSGQIQNPQQLIDVVTSGRLEPVLEAAEAEHMLIRSENEKLQAGQNPPVLRTDNHPIHIENHKVVLNSPELRENPALLQAALEHISQHEQMMSAMQTGQIPGGMVPPAPNEQSTTQAAGQPGASMDATTPGQQAANAVGQPNMPKMPGQ